MKRYADQPFNGEDMYRVPIDPAAFQPTVYQLPRQADDRKKSHFGQRPYSIWSASKYILMISLMLYWLPLVGQMIGGFIGGRRAGSPFRAIIAALIPVAILFGISTALQTGFIPIKLQNATVVAYTLIEQGLSRLPIASPYINFATTYVGSFIDELRTAASLKAGNYLITIAFAYVGGILSDQSRKELEYVSRYGAPTTNILVSGRDAEPRRQFQLPNPVSFFHSLMPSSRRQQNTGFASLMPVPYSAAGAGMRQEMPVAAANAAQEAEYLPQRVIHRRVAAPEARPRSWEDVYLRNMRVAGLTAPGNGRRAMWHREHAPIAPPEDRQPQRPEMSARQPLVRERESRPATPVIRKDRIRDENTRKLVERALGKDYMKSVGKGPGRGQHVQSGQHVAGTTGMREMPRKNGEWELL